MLHLFYNEFLIFIIFHLFITIFLTFFNMYINLFVFHLHHLLIYVIFHATLHDCLSVSNISELSSRKFSETLFFYII
jgi:hypothetical protein